MAGDDFGAMLEKTRREARPYDERSERRIQCLRLMVAVGLDPDDEEANAEKEKGRGSGWTTPGWWMKLETDPEGDVDVDLIACTYTP